MIPNPRPPISNINQILKVSRLLVFGMVMGLFVFGLVAMFMPPPAPPLAPGGGPASAHILLTIAPAFAAVMLPVGFVVPMLITRSIARSHSKSSPESDLAIAQKFPPIVIIRCALWEGAALLNAVTALITGVHWPLGVSAIFAACMIATIPTQTMLDKFTRDVRGPSAGGEPRFQAP